MPPILRRADPADRPKWDAFVASRPEADLLQTWAWGECTALAGEPPIRVLLDDDGEIRGVAQALLRPAGFGRQVAYVPHGPIWDRSAPDAERLFAWLLQGLRTLARKEKALVVKLDPRAEPGDPTDVAVLATAHKLRRAPDLQAPTTRLVDLLDGGTALEASWHTDARRLWHRAEREGTQVTIFRGLDPADIEVLHELLTATAERADFRVRSAEFLTRLATEFAASDGWYLGIARVDGTPIAAMAFPRLANRAYYLYGALLRDDRYRHHYPAHAVMAQMLRALAADGCTTVDMWGVTEPDDAKADPAWKGFSDFKRAFDGTSLRHPGLFDLVTDPFWYRVRQVREKLFERARHSSTKSDKGSPNSPLGLMSTAQDKIELAKGDKHFGWYIDAVDRSFGFLVSDLGYYVDDVVIHHRGTYVWYRLGDRSVVIELDPESRDLRCDLFAPDQEKGGSLPSTNVWTLLKLRDPETDWHEWPRQRDLSNEAIVALLDQWADGLRRLAPDVLRS